MHSFLRCADVEADVIGRGRDALSTMDLALLAVVLRELIQGAKVLRVHYPKQRSRTAKRQTSPVLAHHFLLAF